MHWHVRGQSSRLSTIHTDFPAEALIAAHTQRVPLKPFERQDHIEAT